MASNIPVIVQGNSFSLAIPLQIYYINGDQMDLEDYSPDPTDEVSVQLKGSRRNYTYTPTIDGNVANIDLSGNELADNYSVVVSIVKANGQRLRSFRTDQFFIVESSDDLTTDDIIEGLEENVIYLNSSIFVAGEDGRGIASIVKTGTSGLVDTYTITYTDATTSTFNVTNGAQGAQGADGVGIESIEKTSTIGLVDTYTITMSNGTTTTFEVTNGKDGVDLGLANIVNDLTTGGATNVLSAEMGKRIADITMQEVEVVQTLVLEQGGIDSSGVDKPSTDSGHLKRVRTPNYTKVEGNFVVTVTGSYTNLQLVVDLYTSADPSTFVGQSGGWATSPLSFNFNGYVRVLIKRSNDTNVNPTNVTAELSQNVMVMKTADNLTTKSATIALSANQGAFLGDNIFGATDTPTLEQGSYLTADGTKAPSSDGYYTKRIRNADLLHVNGAFEVSVTTGYKLNVLFYTGNDTSTYEGHAGGWQGASYIGNYKGYIAVTIGKDDAKQTITPTDTTLTFTIIGVEQRVSELEEQLPNPSTFNREYHGELIKIGRNKFKESIYTTLPTFSGYTGLHQCMAVYGDYVLLFTYDTSDATQPATAYLYQLSTATQLAALTLPNGSYMRPHCNSATFSEVFNTADSILPLLYVSQWENNGQKCCFVYDIKLINGTYSVDLVQTILPTNVSAATLGAGQTDWCVDPLGYIYCIGYLLNDGATIVANNKTMITKFALPKVSDGAVVTFGDADVLEHFDVPIFIYRQDLCFENGRIFMLSGVNSSILPKLTVISPDDKRVVSEVSLAYNTNEPEGIGVTDGKLLIGRRNDAKLYRLEFD